MQKESHHELNTRLNQAATGEATVSENTRSSRGDDASSTRPILQDGPAAIESISREQAKAPESVSSKEQDEFKVAGEIVDGYTVRESIPNQSSIAASLDDYTILKGIREVRLAAFDKSYVPTKDARIQNLAEQISQSKEINPLIVVKDSEGIYVLEGGHRLDAMMMLKAKALPAWLLLTMTALQNARMPQPPRPPMQGAAITPESDNTTETRADAGEAITNPVVAELRALKQNITGMREEFALANQTPEKLPASQSKAADQTDAEKAKADFDDALNDLGDIFGSNFRKSMMPEQEQKLMPVLTRLMDAAFRRGYFKFKDAAKFVLNAIRSKFGDGATDSITLDHLQGAYIGMAGRYQEQGADTKKAVIGVESIEEINDHKTELSALETSGKQEDTGDLGNDNDPTTQTDSPSNNFALDAAKPEGGIPTTENVRGARQPRKRPKRTDDGSVQPQGGLFDARNDASENVGDGGRTENISDGSTGNVAGSARRISADYRPGNGDLTRQGSWFDTAKRNIDLIDLARTIEAEKRKATPEEQAQLAKYVGFGAGEIRNNIFPVPPDWAKRNEPARKIWPEFTRDARWKELAERVAALPKEWQESVLQSTQYAHYTSEGIIRSVWSPSCLVERTRRYQVFSEERNAGFEFFISEAFERVLDLKPPWKQ